MQLLLVGTAFQHGLAHLGAAFAHGVEQGFALRAELQSAAAFVLGVGHALDPAVVLDLVKRSRHLCLVGVQILHQFLVRTQRVVAHVQHIAHGIAGEPLVVLVQFFAHAVAVEVRDVVQRIQHLGRYGDMVHGVGMVVFVDKVNMTPLSC
ncbi:hypothetical protein SDC9_158309 [bioreactor metagenome]|uniref:Uncharacterized protein n=1 Tax=bioreactor metagenome TaxID=1076179 RepID=A0A645F9N9_9ZZZZ